MKWLLGMLVAAVAALLIPSQAMAGGWATTLLDPLPDRVEAGHSYTIGFWILQHGSHVSAYPLSSPGLMFDDGNRTLVFKGVPLPEGGHYATAIVLPYDGNWAVVGTQAPFQDYRVGVLSVPGRIAVSPTPEPIPWRPDQSWATVKPPAVAGEGVPAPGRTPVPQAAKGPSPQSLPWALLGIGFLLGVVVSGGVFAVGPLERRRRSTAPARLPTHP
jgi:hypothetical protein